MVENYYINEEPLYPIGTAARMLNVSVHTLRLYEREGLILPHRKDTGHRLYSNADIERVRCIRESINNKKISIEGIKTIYSLIPCWNIKKCPEAERNSCQAFLNHSNPCWSYDHKDNVCVSDCRECIVYKNFSDCKAIKDNIVKLTTNG